MTAQQIKAEIQKSLNEVPDSVLEEVLHYLKEAQGKSQRQLNLSQQLGAILREDRQLLEKLAK